MNRKLAIIVAALVVPGGFVMLAAAFLLKKFGNTPRGRRLVELARARVPAIADQLGAGALPASQAA